MTLQAPITHVPSAAVRSPPSSAPSYWGRLFVVLIVVCFGASFLVGFKTALAVLTIWGFATAVIGVFRPVIGLLGVGMLCTLDPLIQSFLFTGDLLRWHTFDYWLSLVAVGFGRLLLGLNDARSRLAQIFAVLLALEILVSPDWYGGLGDVASIVGLFGLVVYCLRAGTVVAGWRWMGLVCGTAGVLGGIAFVAHRASLPYLNPNAWAFVPLTGLLGVCLAFPLARDWLYHQVVLAMLATANYTLVFLSGSRGALLTASGCGLILLFLTQGMRRRWLVGLSATVMTLAITTQFPDLQTRTVNRINLLVDSKQSLSARTSGRSELLVGGWTIFLEHPLGVGTGGFADTRVSLAEAGRSTLGPEWRLAAHAGWIKILAENGLPGIALMGAYVLSFTVAGWRSRNRDLFMLGLLVTLGLGLKLVSSEYAGRGPWFLAAGVMVLLRHGSVLTRNDPRSA